MARRGGAGARLITRHGHDFTARFPLPCRIDRRQETGHPVTSGMGSISFRTCDGTSALPPIPDVALRHSADPRLADDGDRRSNSGSLAIFAAICRASSWLSNNKGSLAPRNHSAAFGALKRYGTVVRECVLFGQRPRTFRGLTPAQD